MIAEEMIKFYINSGELNTESGKTKIEERKSV